MKESQDIGSADSVKDEVAPATKTRSGFEAFVRELVRQAMQERTK